MMDYITSCAGILTEFLNSDSISLVKEILANPTDHRDRCIGSTTRLVYRLPQFGDHRAVLKTIGEESLGLFEVSYFGTCSRYGLNVPAFTFTIKHGEHIGVVEGDITKWNLQIGELAYGSFPFDQDKGFREAKRTHLMALRAALMECNPMSYERIDRLMLFGENPLEGTSFVVHDGNRYSLVCADVDQLYRPGDQFSQSEGIDKVLAAI